MTMMMAMTMMTMMMMTTQVNEGVDGSNPLTQPVLPPSCLNPLADGDGDDDQDNGNDDDHDEDIEDCDKYGEHDEDVDHSLDAYNSDNYVKGENYMAYKYFRLCVLYLETEAQNTQSKILCESPHFNLADLCCAFYIFSSDPDK